MRSSRVGPKFVQEPDPEHCYQHAHHLDVSGSVLCFLLTRSRVVEQFWLPQVRGVLEGVFQCRPPSKPSELLGSRGIGGARDIWPHGVDLVFISQVLRGYNFPEDWQRGRFRTSDGDANPKSFQG
ncbi:uncharacterized protein A4U43_C08F25670 [Asparagus officinalis]|nr:uncharacterized protein A4U43_C08F25670 [Asparagus officinalis]